MKKSSIAAFMDGGGGTRERRQEIPSDLRSNGLDS